MSIARHPKSEEIFATVLDTRDMDSIHISNLIARLAGIAGPRSDRESDTSREALADAIADTAAWVRKGL